MTPAIITQRDYDGIRTGIVSLVEGARGAAARSVNALMTAAYWEIGRRIVEFEQRGRGRARYGEALITRLGFDLSRRFERGFGSRNLAQMRAFYLAWPPARIVQTPSAQSSLMPTVNDLAGLAKAFTLPGSAYVRLLSVRNP